MCNFLQAHTDLLAGRVWLVPTRTDSDDIWQRGTVARLCPRGAFSHVVAYTGRRRRCAARRTRSSTPPPTAPAGCFSRRPRRRVWPGPFDPGPPRPSESG